MKEGWGYPSGTGRARALGPIIIRVASFVPFHAKYWLNGHPFVEQELNRKQIGFCENANSFLATDDVGGVTRRIRPSQPADHPQATRLLDADRRAEVLKEGTRSDEPVAVPSAFAGTVYNLVRTRNLIHFTENLRRTLRASEPERKAQESSAQ